MEVDSPKDQPQQTSGNANRYDAGQHGPMFFGVGQRHSQFKACSFRSAKHFVGEQENLSRLSGNQQPFTCKRAGLSAVVFEALKLGR